MDLTAASPSDLTRIELSEGDAAAARPERRPITDLVLRLTAGEGTLASALAAANGHRPKGQQPLITIETFVVAGGRMIIDAGARCSGWIGETLICRAACEGGQFALERRTRGGASLTLHVGRLPAGIGEEDEPGWRLMACRDSGRGALSIAPAGAFSASIRLAPR